MMPLHTGPRLRCDPCSALLTRVRWELAASTHAFLRCGECSHTAACTFRMASVTLGAWLTCKARKCVGRGSRAGLHGTSVAAGAHSLVQGCPLSLSRCLSLLPGLCASGWWEDEKRRWEPSPGCQQTQKLKLAKHRSWPYAAAVAVLGAWRERLRKGNNSSLGSCAAVPHIHGGQHTGYVLRAWLSSSCLPFRGLGY